MDFNQLPPHLLQQQQQPQQQNHHAQNSSRAHMPMQLPIQLANLNPQQQQMLRNHPQYGLLLQQQAAVAAARQQQVQQQAVQQIGQHGGGGAGGGSGVMLPQGPMGMDATAGLKGPQSSTFAPQVMQTLDQRANGPIGGISTGIDSMGGGVKEPTSSIPMVPVSPKHWSRTMKEEGKEPTTDTLLYEQLADRDRYAMEGETRDVANKRLIERLMKDLKSYGEIKQMRMKTIQMANNGQFSSSIWGDGYQGYGNGTTANKTQLILPRDRKKGSRVPDLYFSEGNLRAQSQMPEELVPIRLEFDLERDKFKLRDTFLWNLHERLVPLDKFVSMLMEDYRYISPIFSDTILSVIKEQLNDYHSMGGILGAAANASSAGANNGSGIGTDIRIPIKLDITVSNNQLIDQFEWDITNPDNDPEEFAQSMCEELSLSGEFETAISHSIREQAQLYTKALYLIGYSFDGSMINDEEIRSHLSPLILGASDAVRPRTQIPEYTPVLLDVANPELERLDKDRERETRRKRRQGRGRRQGPVLPDLSDVPRTFRSAMPSTILPGGLDLGPDVESYHVSSSRSYKPNPKYLEMQQAKLEQERLAQKGANNSVGNSNNLDSGVSTPSSVNYRSDRVRYHHDPGNKFLVSIRVAH